ncbi:hypothetical protein HSB1_10150 [Halogranum salarium B-1]|uniref:Uncharacterized protein n=1 Tax=Halogranum salarium B-1 TaxID=1210908 RepID=J3EYH6_9EURY|nr:hypothetical protein HSB1_10150 [Halogranum salarium B-1]
MSCVCVSLVVDRPYSRREFTRDRVATPATSDVTDVFSEVSKKRLRLLSCRACPWQQQRESRLYHRGSESYSLRR